MKNWERFERLAKQIFQELSPDSEVVWDKHLDGELTEGKRQIDVTVKTKKSGKEILTIIQVKDLKNRADINVVGKFLSVIQDVKADNGILVCSGGFTKRAKKYGRNAGIKLYNLHDAENLDWNLEIELPIIWIELTPKVEFKMIPKLKKGDTFSGIKPILSDDFGKTRIKPLYTFERLWNKNKIRKTTKTLHHISHNKKLYLRVKNINGLLRWRNVESFCLAYVVEEKKWLGFFKPNRCRGILDYLNKKAFYASYLPLGEIPFTKEKSWQRIDNVEDITVNLQGTVITTHKPILLKPGSLKMESFKASLIKEL